ncbi:MAG: glycosyltransferase family 4 protein [Chloroflexota bacterium]
MTGRVRVLCLTPYPTSNAGVRLRIDQQVPELRRLGIDVTLSPFLDQQGLSVAFRRGHTVAKVLAVLRGFIRRVTDAMRLGEFDLILIYRESSPLGPPFIEWLAHRRNIPIAYDFDEAIFVPNIHGANRAWAWLRDWARPAWVSAIAAAVTVQNEYLAEFARRWNAHVSVIPTPVDTEARRPRETRRPGPVVIGWLGSETTAPYLHLVDEALAQVSASRDVIIRVIGGPYENPGVPRLDVREFALEREQADLESLDIGILPEPDDPWTRGKGGYKALLYMAVGIPVVASRVGVNMDIVSDAETGFCVSTSTEWVAALCRLADDPALRERMGRAGRARVTESHSIRTVAARFALALRAAARESP